MARKAHKAKMDKVVDELKEVLEGRRDPFGTNERKGILYVLSHCKTSMSPSNTPALINSVASTGSSFEAGGRTAAELLKGNQSAAKTWSSGKSQSSTYGKAMKTVIKKIKDFVTWLIKKLGGGPWAQGIINGLPQMIKAIFGGILANITGVYNIGKGLKGAYKAGKSYYSTRKFSDEIKSGHPKTIIEGVRKQIKDSGWGSFRDAVKAGAMMGVAALNPVVATFVGVLTSAFSFFKDLVHRFKETHKLTEVFTKARELLRTGLHRKPAKFQKWFLETIKDMPILSSYFLTMPLTGSYYGFLAVVSYDGSKKSMKQLERNYLVFNDVKKWASKFVKGHAIKIWSDDAIVNHSLKTARQENSFAHNTRGVLKSRLKTTILQTIELAAS